MINPDWLGKLSIRLDTDFPGGFLEPDAVVYGLSLVKDISVVVSPSFILRLVDDIDPI